MKRKYLAILGAIAYLAAVIGCAIALWVYPQSAINTYIDTPAIVCCSPILWYVLQKMYYKEKQRSAEES